MPLRQRIDRALEAWGRLMFRRAGWVLALTAAHCVAMVSLLPELRSDNSTQSFLHGDDPEAVRYDAYTAQFGQDDQVLLAVTPPDLFAPAFLTRLRSLHDEIEADVPHVSEVNSLINARRTRGEDDTLIVEDMLEVWPETEADLAALRTLVFENPLYIDNIVSRDGRTTTISVEPNLYSSTGIGSVAGSEAALAGFDDASAEDIADLEFLTSNEKAELVSALAAIVARYDGPDFEIEVVGGPVISTHITEMVSADVQSHMIAAPLAIVLFLFVLFRRVSGVVLPMAVVVVAMLTTLGTMVAIDMPFSLTLGMLPVFTLTVGVCTTVHILVLVYQQVRAGESREDAVGYAFAHSGLAICMASATTACGMFSFLTAEVAPLQHLGLIAPVAVFYAFAVTMTVLPAMLAYTKLRPNVRLEKRAPVGASERILVGTGAFAVRHANAVLVGAGVVLAVALIGASQLRFAHEPTKWLPPDDPTRIAFDTVDRVLRGSSSVEVVVDSGRENGLHEPANLRRIEAAMQFAEGLEVEGIGIGKAISLVDIVKENHQALNGNSAAHRVIPDSRPVVAQELLLFENSGSDDLEKFTDSRFQLARINMRLPTADAVLYRAYLEELHSGLARTLGDDLKFWVTGTTTLMGRVMSALIVSMGRSYLIALAVITPLMILMIGDRRLGLISMAPNLFPVVLVLGLMGWLDIPLDTSNIVVGSIIIGLAVDDTIHFLQRFRVEFESRGSVEESVRATMRGTGMALFFTSLVLVTGFVVMASLGSMKNTHQFGYFCALGIAVALVADLLITPALIARTSARFRKMRPGESPAAGEPLDDEARAGRAERVY